MCSSDVSSSQSPSPGESANVSVFVADFASIDSGDKLNIIGAGWRWTGVGPSGLVAPMAVVILIETHSRYAGDEVAVTLALIDDETGLPYEMPGFGGPMRIAQNVKIHPAPLPPDSWIPPGRMGARAHLVINLGGGGLPLEPGRIYRWTVAIDGTTDAAWSYQFAVPGPPPAPVLG